MYSLRRTHFFLIFASVLLYGCVLFSFYQTDTLKNNQSTRYSMTLRKLPKFGNPTLKLNSNKASKWIVVSTISPPTDDIKYLSKIPGWRVVVVGDTKTPNNWTPDYKDTIELFVRMKTPKNSTLENCDFLGIQQQNEIGFKITPSLPLNSYARKNLGYLYAIANGAKVIYETDDDNRPLDKLRRFTYSEETTGLMFTEGNTFNPYRYFGQSSMWPRGYPLSQIGENFSYLYTLGKWKTPLVQQGLVNGDPDVDAIFRLTRKLSNAPLNVTFSSSTPPVFVNRNVYSPYNAQNTLHLYDAFWGLFIPSTTTFRVCDIWRAYWCQRLLWEIGGTISFFPPNAYSKRNPHSYLDDYIDEKDLNYKTESLLDFLRNWTCDLELSFFECVIDLTSKMIKNDFYKPKDGELINLWIDDLKSINYSEPQRIHLNQDKNKLENMRILGQIKNVTNTSIIFSPNEQSPKLILRSEIKSYIPQKSINRILHLCPNFNFTQKEILILKKARTYNQLLIVMFNNPLYGNIKILEALYRLYFPNIVYCGINKTLFENMTIGLIEPVTFIEIETFTGHFAQRCVLQALQMNYNVNGYFYLMDDVLLYEKQLFQQRFDKIITHNLRKVKEDQNVNWFWWKLDIGVTAYQSGLNELRQRNIAAYSRFKNTLTYNTGESNGLYIGFADIFYLPAKYKREFIFYMDIFARHGLFLEIAIPTVLGGLEKIENFELFKGTYLSYANRSIYMQELDKKKLYVHPVKFSKMSRKFVCDKIVKPNLFN